MQTKYLRHGIFGMAALSIVVFFMTVFSAGDGLPKKKIAFIGFKEKGKDGFRAGDELSYILLQRAMATEMPGLELKPFRLDRFDKSDDSVDICGIYREIADNPDFVLVVDKTYGRHIGFAQKIIRDRHLPVIALEADRNVLTADYRGHAVFLQPSDFWPKHNVAFLRKVLGDSMHVGLVSEFDYPLHDLYIDSLRLKSGGGTIELVDSLSQKETFLEGPDSKLRERLANFSGKTLVFNVHNEKRDSLKRFFETAPDSLFSNIKHVLGLPFSDVELSVVARTRKHIRFYRMMDYEPIFPPDMEKAIRGGMKKDSVLFKADSDARQHFKNISTAAKMIVGLKNQSIADKKGVSPTYSRLFFDTLISRLTTGIAVFEGQQLMQFDPTGILLSEPTFEYFEGEKRFYNPYQLNIAGGVIPNYHVVVTRPQISAIDVRNNRFTCNFKYWVAVPEDLASKKEQGDYKMNYVNFNLAKTNSLQETPFPPEFKHGMAVYGFEMTGELFNKFNSIDYPFDKHQIWLPVSAVGPRDSIHITFDTKRVNNFLGDIDSTILIHGWDWLPKDPIWIGFEGNFQPEFANIDPFSPDLLDNIKEYKTLGIYLPVRRWRFGGWILVVLPLVLFGLLPICILYFRRDGASKLQDSITPILTSVMVFGYSLVTVSPSTDGVSRAFLMLFVAGLSNFVCLAFTILLLRQLKGHRFSVGWKNWLLDHFVVLWFAVFVVAFSWSCFGPLGWLK